ncbi:uncharacterized protein LOC104296347 isoform X1 [Dryobates pubescens]|uniref:uncharacterized protein LOC104296347 isoform X1 n=1 Tax=Dryobates pubescens TaxID=118200 RepID=UPI0023B925E0|nr:uncharacterized protein LOC104296347 isoform X1 [Dryobates pubescens]
MKGQVSKALPGLFHLLVRRVLRSSSAGQALTLKFRILPEWQLFLAWIYVSTALDPIEESRKGRKGCWAGCLVSQTSPAPTARAELALLRARRRYYTRAEAEHAMRFINGTRLDDRIIRTDWDAGFKEGRQYGRGKTGGQVRDEYRTDYDVGRGGFGKIIQMQKANHQPAIY